MTQNAEPTAVIGDAVDGLDDRLADGAGLHAGKADAAAALGAGAAQDAAGHDLAKGAEEREEGSLVHGRVQPGKIQVGGLLVGAVGAQLRRLGAL